MARCIVVSLRKSFPRSLYWTLARKPATSDDVRTSHGSSPASRASWGSVLRS